MVKPEPLICFSLTVEEAALLVADGPRRDILLVADVSGGRLFLRRAAGSRHGLRGKLAGPHIRHAWEASAAAEPGATVFADGEHVGIPLAAFLALRRKRRNRVVILGHYVGKRWKRTLLWMASRLLPYGTLILHSTEQAKAIQDTLPHGWDVHVIPYQVDTAFWKAPPATTSRPLIVAVGAENRDYATLIDAVRGLDADLEIAAGSHWARNRVVVGALPTNVRFLTETLSFSALRDLYARASVVVAPLLPVGNQSGVTTILEAMSMAKPVIVTATPGQRELITGPLVKADGSQQELEGRGPEMFGLAASKAASGLYVPPLDPAALRRALELVLSDVSLAGRLGTMARSEAVRCFTVEAFASRFAAVITGDPGDGLPTRVAVRAS